MIEAGTLLQNRYLVQEKIGAGGMGAVYLAVDQRFNSTVAVKETFFDDPNLKRAFEREAQLLNSLRHPALPRVSDHFGEDSGEFIVMEYIPGEDLSEIMRRDGVFEVSDVLRWADSLLDALDYLHNQKIPIVHRDIKPQNLKLTPRGEIILLDFGLAKGSAGDHSQVSVTKSIFGYSRNYAPLEQIQGTGTDTRSDLYSLAATLYHILTGKAPTDALSRATAVLNGLPDTLVPAHELNQAIPASVSKILENALALNANLRPATAAEMRQKLAETVTTPLASGNLAAANDELFSQNTKLMPVVESNADLTVAENGFATGLSGGNTGADGEVPVTQINNSEAERVSVAVETPRQTYDREPRRAPVAAIAVAAAILLLGGGAAAYVLNSAQPETKISPALSTSTGNSAPSTSSVATNKETVVTETKSSSVKPAENSVPNVETKTTADNKTDSIAVNPSKTSDTVTTESERQKPVVIVPSAPQIKKGKPTVEQRADAEEETSDALEQQADAEDAPDFTTGDPNNPVDQKRLREYIKKKQENAQKQIREANRRRRRVENVPPEPPKIEDEEDN